MTTQVVDGQRTWSMTRDQEGYRTYKVTFLVRSNTHLDGPTQVLLTPGLPLPGALWIIDNDIDLWAWCRPDLEIKPVISNEKNYFWEVEFTFSNKPVDRDKQRCNTVQIEDPLLEPAKVTVGIANHQLEATVDRFGNPLLTSSWEQITGPITEFSVGRATVRIEQNVSTALQGYQLPIAMLNTVNVANLWGLGRRTIRLSNVVCERRFYGACYLYYNRVLEFEADASTFDKVALDEGTKILNGHWDGDTGAWVLDPIGGSLPDPNNPEHFERFTDRKGNATRVILNGAGLPAGTVITVEGIFISKNGGNTANVLTDTNWWLPFFGDVDSGGNIIPEEYSFLGVYPRGSVVKITTTSIGGGPPTVDYYLCIEDALPSHNPPDRPDKWQSIPGVTNQGAYSAVTTYAAGEYVTDSGQSSGAAGYRYIQKYSESNFLLLGIPVIF